VYNVLQSINTVRAAHSAAALQWDGALAFDALNYAQTCTFDHSTAADYGETLAAGTSTDPSFYISLWAGEEALYDYNKPGFSTATGHFTQLVWKGTTSVGCGFSSGCGSSYPYYLVCRFKTPGNVLG
ncbi:CAP domain-containing protein, partial [Protomyces lactucae-debilis]